MKAITNLLMVIGCTLVMISAIAVIWNKQQSRNSFIELQNLQSVRDQIEVEWGQLQLEQSSWAMHGRVEQSAHDTLKMLIPRPDEVQLVQ